MCSIFAVIALICSDLVVSTRIYSTFFSLQDARQGASAGARASSCSLAKHVDFSESDGGVRWFLEEDSKAFSYAFKDDLKITTDLEKAREIHASDEVDE